MKTLKTIGLILGLVFTSTFASAQEAKGTTITITIENVLSNEGQLLAGLHSAETFMKGQGLQSATVKATKGEVTMTFTNVKPGTYAIMLLHDANDNKRMDFESNGMPKENYVTSGETELYGPPSFKSSKFEVVEDELEFTIRF